MKLNYYYFTFVSLLFILVSSCKISKNLSDMDLSFKNRKQYAKIWTDTLEAGKEKVKVYWTDLLSERDDWDWTKYDSIDFTKEDLLNIELVPIFSYNLDSLEFMNIKSSSNLDKLQTLNLAGASYLVLNRRTNKYVAKIGAGHENGDWYNQRGFTGIPSQISQVIDKHKTANNPILIVELLQYPPKMNAFNPQYIVTYFDGKLVDIWTGELLKDLLIERRALEKTSQ